MTNVQALWRNLLIALFCCVVLSRFTEPVGSFLLFAVCFLYAAFFEYFYHRIIHCEWFPTAAARHRSHHKEWRGESATSTDRTRRNINEDWYLFSAALLVHFFGGYAVLGWFPTEALLAFTLFYLQFAALHWATHMEDNVIDQVLLRIPIVAQLRWQHIEWHLEHHDLPKTKFNFTPPYPGDVVFRTHR